MGIVERIESAADSRIDPYRNLRERTLRGEQLFIAEGELVVRRLIGSPFAVESLLVADRFFPRIADSVPENVPVYLVEESLIREIAGFPFYQGILAVGKRKGFLSIRKSEALFKTSRIRLVVLPHVTKPDNLGLIFRSCAALGATAVLLGPQSCDPFSRRALRVSMGGVLQVPIFREENLEETITDLRQEHAIEFWGTVLDATAQALPEIAGDSSRIVPKIGLLFGNEFEGLDEPWISLCDRLVVIPMSPGVDSLNLGVSVGIFLYELGK